MITVTLQLERSFEMSVFFERKRTEKVTSYVYHGEPGNGGAPYLFNLSVSKKPDEDGQNGDEIQSFVEFQQGHMDSGLNGFLDDQLMAILIKRQECFQEGPFACEENEKILHHLREALRISDERFAARQARGVAGKLEK